MAIDQNDPRMREALEAYRQRDPARAANLVEPLLAEEPQNIDLLQFLGSLRAMLGEFDSAIFHLENARKLQPGNVHVLNSLGLVFKNQGKREEARQCFEHVVAVNPQMAEAHNNLGNMLLAGGDAAGAKNSYEKAIAIKPNFIDALSNLAKLYEREHRLEEAHPLAQRAAKLAPAHGTANLALAQIEVRMGKYQDAVAHLGAFMKTAPLNPNEIAIAQGLIGQALDRLGEYDTAYAAFEAGNAALYAYHEQTVASLTSIYSPENLRRVGTFFKSEDIVAWSKPKDLQGPAPVFLLGFPRSGTTLLDQILTAHSAIESLEEKENLIDAHADLIMAPDALRALGAMSGAEINLYRDKYWARVRGELENASTGGVVIDKLPLNTIMLGLIHRLFPEAKIVFALRDPRDAVLSCFQQRFAMNPAMFQFLKLDMAAAYYDLVMGLAETYRARLPLNLHVVRYEDLIGDMKKTASDLLAFLGLEWEETMMDYRAKARQRRISTPSAEQVIEPLYGSSVGKWRNYERHLAPVMPVLDPWVKTYGYESS